MEGAIFQQFTQVLQSIQENQARQTSELIKELKTIRPETTTTHANLQGLHLHAFDEANETFDTYLQRLENYLELRNLSNDNPENDNKCVQILINCLGPKHYQILTSLTAPDLPKTKDYKELIRLLKTHLCPKPSEIAEQHRFALRIQHEGESIANFVADLKKLTMNCNFKCSECEKSTIATHLRSQFIRGLRDNDIRERLLQQTSPTPTFEQSIEIALSIEMSKKESKQIQASTSTADQVNYIDKEKPNKSTQNTARRNISNPKLQALWGKCFRCGNEKHTAKECSAINKTCNKCKTKGHLAVVCLKSSYTDKQKESKQIEVENSDEDSDSYTIKACGINNPVSRDDKIMIKLSIDGNYTKMELDTGSAITSMSLRDYKTICPDKGWKRTDKRLKTYTGEIIVPIGVSNVKIKYKNETHTGDIYIIDANVDPIFGRDMLRKFKSCLSEIHSMAECNKEFNQEEELQKLLHEYKDIFDQEIGKIPNFKCSVRLEDNNAPPIFMRPRQVPYALKTRVEDEIKRLENAGIIEKVTHSKWGTPIVPVMKKNGNIRLCADYKATINKHIHDDKYPIPKIEDIFAQMSGGKYFCSLDISEAYLHMQVDDATAELQAISTHLGSYKVKRLMYGVKVAPNCWQRYMDQILNGIDGVTCFFDDIKVQGSTYQETLERVKVVFDILRANGLHLNRAKCEFFKPSINYLGHKIDSEGLHTTNEKIEAIVNTHRPKDVSQLRKFLGLINYYQRFLPNLSARLAPLNRLLKKNTKYIWTRECENIFTSLKQEITSTKVLTHFDINIPLTLATDAGPEGIGAVLSHRYQDGTEKPIAFASRSLSTSEKNYSQIDKEATAIVFGLKRFFQYCYGRKFVLICDNKPLTAIFHPHKNMPATSATRMLHYASFLSGFDYKIEYRRTEDHANADYLSRFPVGNPESQHDCNLNVLQIKQLETMPVTQKDIKFHTLKDPDLKTLYMALQSGKQLPNGYSTTEFELWDGCIFKGIRIAIPKPLQQTILQELHTGHIGMVKMKACARSYVWWKGIDNDIERLCRECLQCAKVTNMPPKTYHPWEYASSPMQRVHIDYLGPFQNTYIFIFVDAYSKWVEAVPTRNMTADTTIEILRDIFARFGLPITVVSDNGTQFRSTEFEKFLLSNGIHHKFSAAYHPATNGQAERYVQVVKQGLRSMLSEPGDIKLKLAKLLTQYRKLPNSTTGVSPAELMLRRQIRTRIDLVKRNVKDVIDNGKSPESSTREFGVGETVQVRCYTNKDCKWKFGIVVARKGLMHYDIIIDGIRHTQHVDQIRRSSVERPTNLPPLIIRPQATQNPESAPASQVLPTSSEGNQGPAEDRRSDEVTVTPSIRFEEPQDIRDAATEPEAAAAPVPELRRSARSRKPPNRLNL